jgi:hypothetical protein
MVRYAGLRQPGQGAPLPPTPIFLSGILPKINHEETKSTKKNRKNLRALRFFVVDFHFWDHRFPQPNTFLGLRFTTIGINAWLSVCCGRADIGAAIA